MMVDKRQSKKFMNQCLSEIKNQRVLRKTKSNSHVLNGGGEYLKFGSLVSKKLSKFVRRKRSGSNLLTPSSTVIKVERKLTKREKRILKNKERDVEYLRKKENDELMFLGVTESKVRVEMKRLQAKRGYSVFQDYRDLAKMILGYKNFNKRLT